ncbi:MAG: hypothetical protein GF370_02455 [Candidatus Nealsonbacteria bacterium]|nr:hypothetical protein [Candidatus Nealsonbacteria bacterium]
MIKIKDEIKVGSFLYKIDQLDKKIARLIEKGKKTKLDGMDIVNLCLLRVEILYLTKEGEELARNVTVDKSEIVQGGLEALAFMKGVREGLIETAKQSTY